jgi:hypothetical protein
MTADDIGWWLLRIKTCSNAEAAWFGMATEVRTAETGTKSTCDRDLKRFSLFKGSTSYRNEKGNEGEVGWVLGDRPNGEKGGGAEGERKMERGKWREEMKTRQN